MSKVISQVQAVTTQITTEITSEFDAWYRTHVRYIDAVRDLYLLEDDTQYRNGTTVFNVILDRRRRSFHRLLGAVEFALENIMQLQGSSNLKELYFK